MNILQVNTHDRSGGAAQIAWRLFQAYRGLGHRSQLAVGYRSVADPDVIELDRDLPRGSWSAFWSGLAKQTAAKKFRGAESLAHRMRQLSEWDRRLDARRGLESFSYPAIQQLFSHPRQSADLLHLHNLHGNYFDLRAVIGLSHSHPVVWTLHDQWAFTGHCAYSLGCTRWESGCGQCPDLSLYPAVRIDATEDNHRRKRWVYARSKLYIATPSKWLFDQVDRSPLSLGVIEKRHIANGVDTDQFSPGDREQARRSLGLPTEARILLFSGYAAAGSPFKDFQTVQRAAEIYSRSSGPRILLIALGESREPLVLSDRMRVEFLPYQTDPLRVVEYYRACDAYVHAAKADTFPNVILETLACGRPVAATAVGGIPEQIDALGTATEPTGALAPAGDAAGLAKALEQIFASTERYRALCHQARRAAETKFSFTTQVQAYLSWYREILQAHRAAHAA